MGLLPRPDPLPLALQLYVSDICTLGTGTLSTYVLVKHYAMHIYGIIEIIYYNTELNPEVFLLVPGAKHSDLLLLVRAASPSQDHFSTHTWQDEGEEGKVWKPPLDIWELAGDLHTLKEPR